MTINALAFVSCFFSSDDYDNISGHDKSKCSSVSTKYEDTTNDEDYAEVYDERTSDHVPFSGAKRKPMPSQHHDGTSFQITPESSSQTQPPNQPPNSRSSESSPNAPRQTNVPKSKSFLKGRTKDVLKRGDDHEHSPYCYCGKSLQRSHTLPPSNRVISIHSTSSVVIKVTGE
jgi:hypothetical protein